MKKYKYIILLLSVLLFSACRNSMNTPTYEVENYFTSYQNLDKSVLRELTNEINQEDSMNKQQKEKYLSLLEKQYQNLSFKIKNEEIMQEMAIVDTEIEVLDYASTITRSKKYYLEHQEEFSDKVVEEKYIDLSPEFIDYKLEELAKVENKDKYFITFSLKRNGNNWVIEKVGENEKLKMKGLY